MNEQEFQQVVEKGQVQFIEPASAEPTEQLRPNSADDYTPLVETLRRPRRHLTAEPNFTPRNLMEQIQFYDDGADRRVYFYVNGTWSYTTLT